MDSSDQSDTECEILERVIIARRTRTIRDAPSRFGNFDDKNFRDRFRISKAAAWMVLRMIGEQIQHKITWNSALTPEEMLLLNLRFYATGCMQRTGGDLMGVSPSTASRVIRLVSHQIALRREEFIAFPPTAEGQRQVQQKFYLMARFPRVLAALDCTHVKIISPDSGHALGHHNPKSLCKITKSYPKSLLRQHAINGQRELCLRPRKFSLWKNLPYTKR
ncbi:PREDICTED: putative nuclease HARBI1 [Rhagoletis zephyria]|uniref:putative nuclease HARBI1 n=1 Tax=Rhagoletis zephyria TaxID=28612 RepID=UPI000811A94F|nr:PREDICTED: putative nuclease HARBI1 [Rhagoletis zephyria]